MTRVERVVAAVAASLAIDASIAHAQSAAAEALFREGRALIKSGELDAGCNKLEASEKLENSVGTLLNLGDCREKQGRYATAWAAFRKAEGMAQRAGKDEKRQREAGKRAELLESSLATITIQVGEKAEADGLVIKRDGETLDSSIWGTAIVVDPGEHTIVAEAPGAKPWTSEVSVGKGGKRWVVVPTLEREVVAVEPPVVVAKPPVVVEPPRHVPPPPPKVVEKPPVVVKPPQHVAPPPKVVAKPPVVVKPPRHVERHVVVEPPRHVEPPPPPKVVVVTPVPVAAPPRTIVVRHTWSTTRRFAVGLAAVGLGTIGGGIYVGHRSGDLEDQANAICPFTVCNDARALRLNDDAQSQATAANVLFTVGGAAAVTATVLWIVGKPEAETIITPSIGDSHVGASLAGRF